MTRNWYEMDIRIAMGLEGLISFEYPHFSKMGNPMEPQMKFPTYHRKSFTEWSGVNFHK